MGKFGKWLEEKDPVALNELTAPVAAPVAAPAPVATTEEPTDDVNPADKAAEQKLSATIEQHLTRLIGDLDKLKSRKMKAAILVRVLSSLKDGGVKQQVVKQLMTKTYA